MLIEKNKLWGEKGASSANYTKYLLDNLQGIDENRKRPAIIVFPGGAYMSTADKEAEPIAMIFLRQGYNAFVLRYTTKSIGDPTYPTPLLDIAKMISTVRENAEEWNVDSDRIAIIGFSAGGHLCANLAVHWQDNFLNNALGVSKEQVKPNALILGYPILDFLLQNEMLEMDENAHIVNPIFGSTMVEFMHLANEILCEKGQLNEERYKEVSPMYHVSGKVPPTFIWHTGTDEYAYVVNSLKFGQELTKHKVPFEMHIFESGAHGLALANWITGTMHSLINEDVAIWPKMAIRFLNRHFNIALDD